MCELVSVIIPAYNCEKYIKRCLNSVCKQTYKNLEIIVINDGSTDNTSNICKEFLKNDSRIKFISTSNRGVSSARNIGINISTGKYICFLDADDYININMIEECLKLLLDNEADIICFNREEFFVNGKQNKIIDIYNTQLSTYDIIKGIYNRTFSCNINDKFYKKGIWKDVRFPNIRTAEDMYALFDVLRNALKIIATDQIYYYYQRGDNSSATGKVMLDVYFNNFMAYRHGAGIAKNKWDELYDFALKKSFYYAIKAYQHGFFIDYLKKIPNKEIEIFFNDNKKFIKQLGFLEQLYLYDYFYFHKLCNRLKGVFYYLKWRRKLF